jgi:hypothetical protein
VNTPIRVLRMPLERLVSIYSMRTASGVKESEKYKSSLFYVGSQLLYSVHYAARSPWSFLQIGQSTHEAGRYTGTDRWLMGMVDVILFSVVRNHTNYTVDANLNLIVTTAGTENVLTAWPSSTSELYRPNDRHLLVPTFADKGCSVVSAADPYGRNLGFLGRSRYPFFQVAPQL